MFSLLKHRCGFFEFLLNLFDIATFVTLNQIGLSHMKKSNNRQNHCEGCQFYITITFYSSGKPHGIRTARKFVNHRREQRWHDKDYKKAHLPSRWVKPFQGSSHAKGIVLEKVYVSKEWLR